VHYSLGASFDSLKDEGMIQNNSIYNQPSMERVLEILKEFAEKCREKDILFFDQETITKIITKSGVPLLKEGLVKTHIKNLEPYWEAEGYHPKIITRDEVSSPNYVDLHVLRGE
jgi:hypothetical protein